jgi:flavin-dependent dehydrogenase
VGAGPAGSTTALLLARAGVSVLLLDRARFPRDKPCSEYLSPATTDVLERLGGGILAAVERTTHARLYGMKVVSPGGAAMVGRFRGASRPYSFAVPRTSFDAILLAAAARAGARVREGTSVEDLVWDRGAVAGVVARSRDGQRATYRARIVIGADGLRSVVARRLGLVRTSPPRRFAFTAHVADVGGVDELGELHVSDRGYVGLGPVGAGITTVALVLPLRVVRGSGRDHRSEFVAELNRFPGLAGRFDARRLVRGVLTTGPFAQWARVAALPGALLVGDAADFFDPFTGQGIHTALRGAELVAESLIPWLTDPARKPGVPGVSRAYTRARRREFAGKWLLERLIGLGVGSPALTDRVVGRLARRPDLADLLVSATGNVLPARRVFTPSVLARLLW